MKLATVAVVALTLFSCDKTPHHWRDEIETTAITHHRLNPGAVMTGECEFNITLGGREYTYTGIPATAKELEKCRAMKNGEEVMIVRTYTQFSDGNTTEQLFFAKAGEIEFPLKHIDR